ncbi:MAG: TolC family protein, partial [Thermoanaerobaculia bacterium]
MRTLFFIVLFSLNIFSEPVRITLEDAIKIALENNKEIKKVKFENEGIYGRYLEERSQAFPKLSFSGYGSKQMDETFYKFSQGLFPK